MKTNNQFLFFTKGQVDESLKKDIVYAIDVVDAAYSPVLNKVQVLYSATDWDTNLKGYMLEEYDPMSEKFKEILNTAFYISEDAPAKKICIEEFRGCWFFAKLTFESGVPAIDWKTVDPRTACDCDLS